MDCRSEEEAGYDGRHRHRDAREDNDEVVGEAEVAVALPEALFRE